MPTAHQSMPAHRTKVQVSEKTKARVEHPARQYLDLFHSIITIKNIQDIPTYGGGDARTYEIMLGSSKLRVTCRACAGRYRQYGVWLWKEILFSIEWYHLIPFMAIRYWFKAVELGEKMYSGPNMKSHKTEMKAKVQNPTTHTIRLLSNSIIIIKNIITISQLPEKIDCEIAT